MILGDCTTLRLGGAAARFAEPSSEDELVRSVAEADERGEPVFVLGGGSNVVFADAGFDGVVVRAATRGIVTSEPRGVGRGAGDQCGVVHVDVAAGEPWDDLVAWSVREGLSGLDSMSGIPGLVGATPMQNVGAYGQEIKDTLVRARVFDRRSKTTRELSAAECRLSYRHSMLKEDPSRWVVLRFSFALERSARSRPVRYAELARALGVREGEPAELARVRRTVLALRRGKGMVLDARDPDTRSAGSFFVNPTLTASEYAALAARAGAAVPKFESEGKVKVPAAWLIERAGFAKGHRRGGAAISTKHALALTTREGATTEELLALARESRDGVERAFGVRLTPEPVLVGCIF